MIPLCGCALGIVAGLVMLAGFNRLPWNRGLVLLAIGATVLYVAVWLILDF